MKKIFSPAEKGRIALEAVKGTRPLSQIASAYEVHPNVVGQWKKTLLENAGTLFSDKRKKDVREKEDLIDRLYQTIGKREAELEWLKKKLHLES